MQQRISLLKLQLNAEDEIITRIDECERLKADCPNKDCPYQAMIAGRVGELKRALTDHILL